MKTPSELYNNDAYLNLADAGNSIVRFTSLNKDFEKQLKVLEYYQITDTTPSLTFGSQQLKHNGRPLNLQGDIESFGEIELEFLCDEYYEVYESIFNIAMLKSCMSGAESLAGSIDMVQSIMNNDSKPILDITYSDIKIIGIEPIVHTVQDGLTELNFSVSFSINGIDLKRYKVVK